MSEDSTHILSRCLSLDLEVSVRDERIRAFAGVRQDTGRDVVHPSKQEEIAAALARLDDLSNGAEFLLGHNLIAFDLPYLRAANPGLSLLRLPAVDTLMLNPLAFPRNPYHGLVKHYQDGQLKRGRINDPILDARLVLHVFAAQQNSLSRESPDLLAAWHWLITQQDGEGFDIVFASCGARQGRPTPRRMTRLSHGWKAFPAGHTHGRSWRMRPATAGPWLTLWLGCRYRVTTRSCLPGCASSTQRRGAWSGGCVTQYVPTRAASGAGTARRSEGA